MLQCCTQHHVEAAGAPYHVRLGRQVAACCRGDLTGVWLEEQKGALQMLCLRCSKAIPSLKMIRAVLQACHAGLVSGQVAASHCCPWHQPFWSSGGRTPYCCSFWRMRSLSPLLPASLGITSENHRLHHLQSDTLQLPSACSPSRTGSEHRRLHLSPVAAVLPAVH